jgi:hypothetical protein
MPRSHSRFVRAGLGLAAAAALLSLGVPAQAQQLTPASPAATAPSEGTLAKAQSLFVEGRAAMERGDFPAACARFTASLALMTRASTLLNLAQCETHEGQLVNAARHSNQGIDLLPADDERLAISKERAAAVARRLAHLTVKLTASAPPGTRVELDGVDTKVSALLGGLPANPGRHVIVLAVPGQADQRSTVDLAEGDVRTVTLTILEIAAVAPPTPAVTAASRGSSKRTVGFILGGIGVAGFIGAGVTGGLLISKHSAINSACPDKHCSAEGLALIESTKPLNVVNAVAWGVGLAGLAGGVVLVVLGRNDDTATAIAPTALAGGGGLSVTQTF